MYPDKALNLPMLFGEEKDENHATGLGTYPWVKLIKKLEKCFIEKSKMMWNQLSGTTQATVPLVPKYSLVKQTTY